MADFKKAYKFTSAREGGWVVDNGGPTYAGIAFNYWTSNADAVAIRKYIAKKYGQLRTGQHIKTDAVLEQMVYNFYKHEFWDKRVKGDAIGNQVLANFIYDFSVNSNGGPAVVTAIVSGTRRTALDAWTIAKINSNPSYWYGIIKNARQGYYDSLVANDSKLKKYYNGWMNRLAAFPGSLAASGASLAGIAIAVGTLFF